MMCQILRMEKLGGRPEEANDGAVNSLTATEISILLTGPRNFAGLGLKTAVKTAEGRLMQQRWLAG